MDQLYFTITGTGFRYGQDFLEPHMQVRLVKEPDNEYDREAIRVEMAGLGLIGYVANSIRTVIGESCSAGRLYDKIGDEARGTVLYVLPQGVLCRLDADASDAGDADDEDDDEDEVSMEDESEYADLAKRWKQPAEDGDLAF
ncbi:MAG: HIRAN domain-containing protein [Firmicutes bacterium]|nr:HIRAN domain-containing protein [Bacillota bacterium]